MQLPEPPRWVNRARCGRLDPELFFPPRGANEQVDLARAVCLDCPVRWECLELGFREKFGVWGGMSEKERKRLRRDHPTAQEAVVAVQQAEADERRRQVAGRARAAALRAKRQWQPAYLRQEAV